MIASAEHTIEIASYYWTLLDEHITSRKGRLLFNALMDAAKSGIKLKIVVNDNNYMVSRSEDLHFLKEMADIRLINFERLIGAGILHTKFIVVDHKHLYIGSANMDWRSLTQVKELGIAISNCPLIAEDLSKIFEIYWLLGESNAQIPLLWPTELSTEYNRTHPLPLLIDRKEYNVFLSSSPVQLCADGRTDDLEAVLSIIGRAQEFIYISVMDFYPMYLFTKDKLFWPIIDNSLRGAVINRKVNIRLMASLWNSTRSSMKLFLHSLRALSDNNVFGSRVEVKLFKVPVLTPSQAKIPHSRVNHNKMMVTDKEGYIGTNNWSADYFVNTGGVGITIIPHKRGVDLKRRLRLIFERDWNSVYAHPL